MLAQCSGGTKPPRLRQLLTADWVTPMAIASALTPPACFVASVSASIARDYHERVRQVNTGVIFSDGISLDMDTLPCRLTYARESRGLTQTQLAKLAGVGQSTVGNIEAGIRGGLNSLAPIANALQIRYQWLRDGDGEMELPRTSWPFTADLAKALNGLSPEGLRLAENQLRAHLDMEPIRRPVDESGKRDGTHG